uniref:Uncharacterized protein n=1 Tax=Lotharella oceanica TaxID=641309 RepID=A0A7S2TZ48_9EUKA
METNIISLGMEISPCIDSPRHVHQMPLEAQKHIKALNQKQSEQNSFDDATTATKYLIISAISERICGYTLVRSPSNVRHARGGFHRLRTCDAMPEHAIDYWNWYWPSLRTPLLFVNRESRFD